MGSKFDDPISTLPEQIAQSLVIDQNLPQLIADRIQASTLSADTGVHTATQVLTTGVKVVDQPVAMFDEQVTALSTTHNYPAGAAFANGFDTSEFQSLIIAVDWQTAAMYVPNSYMRIDIRWSNGETVGSPVPSRGYAFVQTVHMYGWDDRGVSAVRVPCMGAVAQLSFHNQIGVPVDFHYWAQGSQRAITDIDVEQNVGGIASGNPQIWHGDAAQSSTKHLGMTAGVANVGGVLAPLPPRGGLVEVTVMPTNTTTAVGRFSIVDHLQQRIGPTVQMPVGTPLVARVSWQAQLGYHPAFVWNDTPPTGAGPLFISAAYL